MNILQNGKYKGWDVQILENRWIRMFLTRQLGGRIIQIESGGYGFLFVNPLLAGFEPDETRLGKNSTWLNFGGEKVWVAPQGWDSPDQWPGPPDPVIDSGIYSFGVEKLPGREEEAVLTSPVDLNTGLQVVRRIMLLPDASGASVHVAFLNRGGVTRKWSVWPVCQVGIPAGKEKGMYQVVCPVNPESIFNSGFKIMHGLVNNPQVQVNDFGNLVVNYEYLIGKTGLDCQAGWVAGLNRKNGKVLVLKFSYDEEGTYPENTSVHIWSQGRGMIFSRNRIADFPDDQAINPPYMEMELLSPLHEVPPGGSCSFGYTMVTGTLPAGADIRSVHSSWIGSSPLEMKRVEGGFMIEAKYGFFTGGILRIRVTGPKGKEGFVTYFLDEKQVTPLEGVVVRSFVKTETDWPIRDLSCEAEFTGMEGVPLLKIETTKLQYYGSFKI